MKCNKRMEVYSRVVGFFRPVNQWNIGMQEQYKDRVTYKTDNQPINKRKESE